MLWIGEANSFDDLIKNSFCALQRNTVLQEKVVFTEFVHVNASLQYCQCGSGTQGSGLLRFSKPFDCCGYK